MILCMNLKFESVKSLYVRVFCVCVVKECKVLSVVKLLIETIDEYPMMTESAIMVLLRL